MAINVTSNPALTLALGVASATIAFTTDATPAIQTTATSTKDGSSVTVGSNVGLAVGDFLAIEGAAFDGVSPYIAVVNGFNSGVPQVAFPSVRATVTGAVCNRMERIETRYKAKKLVLTNLTNGDTYTWQVGMALGSATKVSGGVTTTVASNTMSNRSNCVAIHPNILPASCSFTLQCDYRWYGAQ